MNRDRDRDRIRHGGIPSERSPETASVTTKNCFHTWQNLETDLLKYSCVHDVPQLCLGRSGWAPRVSSRLNINLLSLQDTKQGAYIETALSHCPQKGDQESLQSARQAEGGSRHRSSPKPINSRNHRLQLALQRRQTLSPPAHPAQTIIPSLNTVCSSFH